MKYLLSFILFFLSGIISSQAQVQPYNELDLNNIRARFFADGGMFRDNANAFDTLSTGFEVPKGSEKSTIYSSRLWIGGMEAASQSLHLAAEKYGYTEGDFFPGTLTTDGTASCIQTDLYNRVWKINRTTIDSFTSGLFFNSIPPSFADWPAHGDTSLGEAFYIAPFVDINNDGFYQPFKGDYPKIRGDQALFFVFNDNCGIHTETGANAIGIEIHGMAYAFNCPQDSAIANTIFVHYDIINRGSFTLDNTYVGLWSDMDVGSPMDDYMQCDVIQGSYFTYNGIASDGSGGPGQYGSHPPAQGVVFLGGPFQDINNMDDAVGIGQNQSLNGFGFGDGIVDNERVGLSHFLYHNNDASVTGDPELAIDYYNLMNGIWRDGTHFSYGANGHGGSIPADFMFPGNSDQQYYWGTGGVPVPFWSETTSQNTPYERRGLGSSGPFTMEPGEVNPFDIAFVFGRDYDGNNVESIFVMKERIDAIKSMFLANETTCGGSISSVDPLALNDPFSVYPNPVQDILTVAYTGSTEHPVIEVFNVNGQKVLSGNLHPGKTEVNTQALVPGIYILRISSSEGSIHVQKIVKN